MAELSRARIRALPGKRPRSTEVMAAVVDALQTVTDEMGIRFGRVRYVAEADGWWHYEIPVVASDG